jgi:hypothetical protein
LKSQDLDVPFTQVRNYFVKNDYRDSTLHSLKITNQIGFYKYFGMAATMGNNVKPTPVDFTKQYIVALIAKASDDISELKVSSFKKINQTILITYEQIKSEKQHYAVRHLGLLIVNNAHQGEIKLQEK